MYCPICLTEHDYKSRSSISIQEAQAMSNLPEDRRVNEAISRFIYPPPPFDVRYWNPKNWLIWAISHGKEIA